MKSRLSLWILSIGTCLAANASVGFSISMTHTGSFIQGQTNAVYLIRVTNTGTTGTIPAVTDIAPVGITVTAMRGEEWACSGNSCTTSTVLASGQSHPAISVLVTVASNAAGSLTNQAIIGAGTFTSTANDVTTITPPGKVVAWGSDVSGESDVPAGLTNVAAIAAGTTGGETSGPSHSLALKGDGTVVAWGDNTYGETSVPVGLANVTAIAAGYGFSLALKSDDTIVGWGNGIIIPSGLTDVVAISAGPKGSLALTGDGTVVPLNGNIATPQGLSNVTAIAAGGAGQVFNGIMINPSIPFNVALRSDGTVVAWDPTGSYGLAGGNTGTYLTSWPTLTGITSISTTSCDLPGRLGVGLKSDGTVVNLSDGNTVSGLTSITGVAWGCNVELALKNDGTVVPVPLVYPNNPPVGLMDVSAIAAGSSHLLALTFIEADRGKHHDRG